MVYTNGYNARVRVYNVEQPLDRVGAVCAHAHTNTGKMQDMVELWNANMYHGWLLILSNLALLPSIALATHRGRMATAIALVSTFVASVSYHTCRAWNLCVMELQWAIATDYLFVYWSMIFILTSLGLRRHGTVYFELHVYLFFVIMAPTAFAIMAHVHFSWLPVFGIGVPIFVTVAVSFKTGNRLFYNKPWTVATFLLAGAGGVCMFAAPQRFYFWAHTLWHVFSMLASFTFLIATDDNSVDTLQHRADHVLTLTTERVRTNNKTRRKRRPLVEV